MFIASIGKSDVTRVANLPTFKLIERADEVVRRLPRGELRVLPGLGHTINYTAPKEFVSAMRPFLRV
jgi:pimeloyl-ACP methyl ester carboxylesterase